MSKYIFSFQGREHDHMVGDYDTVDEARNEAVRYLGAYLAEHPGFSDEGHWRVNVSDDTGQTLLHVIVATVTSSGSPLRGDAM